MPVSNEILSFDSSLEFSYHWCGLFIAPDSHWIHLTRTLPDYEFILVTDGILYIASDSVQYTVNAGEYLLMSPTSMQYGVKNSECRFYWLHFGYNNEINNHVTLKTVPGDISSDTAFPAENDISPVISIPRFGRPASPDRIIMLCKQLQDSDKRYRNSSLNRYLTGAVLSELALQMSGRHSVSPERSKKQLYSDITAYISWHISDALRVSDIAAYFDYNEKYLTTFFKAHAGIPLKSYIIKMKMEHAQSVLSETDTPVSQVAYQLGFKDVHNFSNAFKAAVGMSPGRYRELYNKHNIFDR